MRSTVRVRTLGWGGAAALVVLTACSSTGTSGAGYGGAAPSVSSAPSSTSSPAGAGADLRVADTALGAVVVDRAGKTAYYFDKDKPGSGTSTCVGGCLATWPAIVPASSTPSVDGVTAKVGTITRDDGTVQLTVEGRPVYLFAKDSAPGEVKGQGVGGVWYVIAPDGSEVTSVPASAGY
jgi:predicted lipoprotein with Yx(FWY)xxD motif